VCFEQRLPKHTRGKGPARHYSCKSVRFATSSRPVTSGWTSVLVNRGSRVRVPVPALAFALLSAAFCSRLSGCLDAADAPQMWAVLSPDKSQYSGALDARYRAPFCRLAASGTSVSRAAARYCNRLRHAATEPLFYFGDLPSFLIDGPTRRGTQVRRSSSSAQAAPCPWLTGNRHFWGASRAVFGCVFRTYQQRIGSRLRLESRALTEIIDNGVPGEV